LYLIHLNKYYFEGNDVKEIQMGEICNMHRKDEKGLKNLSLNRQGKRSLVRCRCRWEYSTEMDINEIVIKGVNWIELSHPLVDCYDSYELSSSIGCGGISGIVERVFASE
jgi:hypothetical protein